MGLRIVVGLLYLVIGLVAVVAGLIWLAFLLISGGLFGGIERLLARFRFSVW